MTEIDGIIRKIVSSNEEFVEYLRSFMKEKKYTMHDLSQASAVPESTLYKIMSDPKKDFRISTFRQIVSGLTELSGEGDTEVKNMVAVITSREALDTIGRNIRMKGRDYHVKEYPATTIEEEIIQGIEAERDGALGILCGPIAATTLAKVVRIPVTALRFRDDTLHRGLEKLVSKV